MEETLRKTEIGLHKRFAAAALLGALAAIAPLCTDLYLSAFPAVAQSLEATASQVQLSLTFCLLGIAAGQIFIGPYSDMKGRRGPLLVSLIVFVLVSFLCARAASIAELIGLRFVQGVAGSGGIVLSRAIACDLYEGPELTKFFSLLMLINGIAPIVSPVAGSQILRFTNWNGVFLFLAAVGLVLLAAVCFGLKETLPKERRSQGNFRGALLMFEAQLKDKRFMNYVLIHSFVMAGLFGYIAASPFVLQAIYGLSAEAFSLCFAMNGIGIMAFAQLTGKYSARYGDAKILKFGLVLACLASAAVLLAALLRVVYAPVMIAALFIVVSCVGITTTTSFTLAIQSQKKAAGSASGVIGVVSFIFGAAASPLVGLGGSLSAVPMGVVLFAVSLLSLLFYAAATRRRA